LDICWLARLWCRLNSFRKGIFWNNPVSFYLQRKTDYLLCLEGSLPLPRPNWVLRKPRPPTVPLFQINNKIDPIFIFYLQLLILSPFSLNLILFFSIASLISGGAVSLLVKKKKCYACLNVKYTYRWVIQNG
jgi:hypothetical protein